jgi:Nuclease-related domain
MSVVESARASVVRHQRDLELSSDQRAGARSRREVRKAQRVWLGKNRRVLPVLAAGVGILCGAIQIVKPAFLRPYLVGATIASAAWMVHYVMVLTGGVFARLVGIVGETSTNDELRGLRRKGWHVVNHVMLEHRDVDHVLLGPGGFFSIETKFRSEWEDVRRSAAGFAPRARNDAHSIAGRIDRPKAKVHPVVVLWGGRIGTIEPEPFEVGGVTFCAGTLLRGYLESVPSDGIAAPDVQAAFDALDRYVQKRDVREIATDGDFVRNPTSAFYDFLLALAGAMATLLLVAEFAQLSPSGLWGVPPAAAIVAGSVWLRRTPRSSPRSQRLTAAVMTVALFMAGLTLAIWAIDTVTR